MKTYDELQTLVDSYTGALSNELNNCYMPTGDDDEPLEHISDNVYDSFKNLLDEYQKYDELGEEEQAIFLAQKDMDSQDEYIQCLCEFNCG